MPSRIRSLCSAGMAHLDYALAIAGRYIADGRRRQMQKESCKRPIRRKRMPPTLKQRMVTSRVKVERLPNGCRSFACPAM